MRRKTMKNKRHIYAKNATNVKCRIKSCKAKKYQSVYGMSKGGGIRELIGY